MKLYPMKRFIAMQFRRGGWIPPVKTGWVAFGKLTVIGRTKKQAVQKYKSAVHQMEART